jgi:hypothetical protein
MTGSRSIVFVKWTTVCAISVIAIATVPLTTRVSYSAEFATVLQSKVPTSSAPAAVKVPNMDKWTDTWILDPQKSTYGDSTPLPAGVSPLRQILKIRVSVGRMHL